MSQPSPHSGNCPADCAHGNPQLGGAFGLVPPGREQLPQPPPRFAIQLHWPAGIPCEPLELLATVLRGSCSSAHTGHLGDGYRLLAHPGIVTAKNVPCQDTISYHIMADNVPYVSLYHAHFNSLIGLV